MMGMAVLQVTRPAHPHLDCRKSVEAGSDLTFWLGLSRQLSSGAFIWSGRGTLDSSVASDLGPGFAETLVRRRYTSAPRSATARVERLWAGKAKAVGSAP
jgi:hypothetical protein